MSKKVSLAELMGGEGAAKSSSLTLDQLPLILGDAMPEMTKDNVGRFRLIKALQQRYGKNFRRLPGVSGLIKEFDEDVKFEHQVGKMKKIRIMEAK